MTAGPLEQESKPTETGESGSLRVAPSAGEVAATVRVRVTTGIRAGKKVGAKDTHG